MKGKVIPQELKDLILDQIQKGQLSVIQAASENNLSAKTIYNWFSARRSTTGGSSSTQNNLLLENARLKREKQELVEIIGKMAVQIEQMNRNFKKNDN